MRTLFLFLLAGAPLLAAPPLDEILARLADSQERAVEARKSVVYRQNVHTRMLRGGGKVAREEKREYTVTPSESGTSKELARVEGRYEKHGKLLPYSDPKFRHKDVDLDGEITESLTDDLVNDQGSRDGISKDIFPLTRAEQAHYSFKLAGTRQVAGVEAYVLKFEPRKRDGNLDDEIDGRPWSGEVLVHPGEFQPLSVTTNLGKVIPGWVKVVFGINLKQMGFSLTYRKVADGLWFPATYGTEFGLRLFFGYGRTITMSMENTDFRLATAESTITYTPESPDKDTP